MQRKHEIQYSSCWVELTCMRDVCDPINEFNQRTQGNVKHCLFPQGVDAPAMQSCKSLLFGTDS